MKTKRQGQSKLFVVLATLLAIVFFSFAGETDVKAAETYTQNYTPTRKSPLKKIEYINRGDNTFDINVTVDLSVYYPNDVLGIHDYDITAWTNGTSGKEYVALIGGEIDVGKYVHTHQIRSEHLKHVKPGEKFWIRYELYKNLQLEEYGPYCDFEARELTAPTIKEPEQTENLFSKVNRYTWSVKSSNGKEYSEINAEMEATKAPGQGESLWAYNKDDGMIYGRSFTNKIKALVYRDLESKEIDITGVKTGMVLVIAKDAASAKTAGDAITLKDSDRVRFDQAAYTKSVAAKDYKFQMGSDRYDQLIGYIDASSYSYATAHIVEVYNYSTKNGEGSLFKRYVIKGSNNYQRSFKLTGLKPGTAKHYTVHLIRTDSSGTEYEYIDNQYWTLKSASFKTPSVSGVKFAPKKAKLIINVPSTQAGKGLSTMHVYKGNKKIKTIKSNGKTRITFVYSGSKASTSSYKVKAVCAKDTKITKTSKAKKPVASKYKRQGWINPNINAITPYATATFVPWKMSYYNGKVTVTGYVVNNRIFKLKTYKVKVGVGIDNKIYASTTKTYKNVKDSTIKKVTFSFKSKKALDFVNNSPTWSVRTLKSVW